MRCTCPSQSMTTAFILEERELVLLATKYTTNWTESCSLSWPNNEIFSCSTASGEMSRIDIDDNVTAAQGPIELSCNYLLMSFVNIIFVVGMWDSDCRKIERAPDTQRAVRRPSQSQRSKRKSNFSRPQRTNERKKITANTSASFYLHHCSEERRHLVHSRDS